VTLVAKAGLLDKAMALIPRGAKPNAAKRRPDARKQLAVLQKKLATLVEDVEKLAELIGRGEGRPAPRRRTGPGGKPASPRLAGGRRRRPAKVREGPSPG
jgi:hypothetical protein